ncbi:unnamed protein product [Effrenium voratum]|nr:unnamed protein product [Effrenium voratum]
MADCFFSQGGEEEMPLEEPLEDLLVMDEKVELLEDVAMWVNEARQLPEMKQVYDEPCALSGLDGKLDEISLKIDALAEVVRGRLPTNFHFLNEAAKNSPTSPEGVCETPEPLTSPPSAAEVTRMGGVARRRQMDVRRLDLQVAWHNHAKEALLSLPSEELLEEAKPFLKLVRHNRCDALWELLDDPSSSRWAWATSGLLKLMVVVSVIISLLQSAEEVGVLPWTLALEIGFDAIFLLEFLCRIVSAPSKNRYFIDPLNWADVLSAFGLPVRVFLVFNGGSLTRAYEVSMMLFLPIIRFLKLLRYFESFRLLIDAGKNSMEALPLLSYFMAIITLVAATAFYLAEDETNIPTLHHAMWLAIVTMTTVGYGDFYPRSLGGYISASALTFVSVLFLALPVGIIGHEFTSCWQMRKQVLLKNRIRKCLLKWGYNAEDLRVLIEYVDADKDGNLTLGEFIELIRQMRIGIPAEGAIDLFMLFDHDLNGHIDYSEFLRQIFPEEYVKEKQMQERESMRKTGYRVSCALIALGDKERSMTLSRTSLGTEADEAENGSS